MKQEVLSDDQVIEQKIESNAAKFKMQMNTVTNKYVDLEINFPLVSIVYLLCAVSE